MDSHSNTTKYNQDFYYNLIYPLHTMVPMTNASFLYPEPIPSYPSSLPLPPSFNVEPSFNPNPLLSPSVHRVKKRKSADSLLECSSSSPLSTPSYSSTTSFPDANFPSKKSKNTLVPAEIVQSKQQGTTREETQFTEDEVDLRQRSLERNRLAASKCRQRKKEWIEELAQKAERMSRENEYLKHLLLQLKEEALFLKTQLMMRQGYVGNLRKSKEYFNILHEKRS